MQDNQDNHQDNTDFTPDLGAALREARRLRDEGIEVVSRSEFTQAVVKAIPRMRVDILDYFSGEDLRHWLTSNGITPHDPHGWGGAVMGLALRGEIVQVGHTQMKDAKSHARETKLYRWAGRRT